MGGVLQQSKIVADVWQSLFWSQEFDRQPLECRRGGQAVGNIERILPTRDPPFVRRDFPAELEILLRQLLVKLLAELIFENGKQYATAAERTKIMR